MYELKELEMYWRINLLGPGPHLLKKELTGRVLTKIEKNWSSALPQTSVVGADWLAGSSALCSAGLRCKFRRIGLSA
jgi:hypothetical protein